MNKSYCLNFGDFVSPKEVEDNLGIDIGTVPMFWDDMRLRDHIDNNSILAET